MSIVKNFKTFFPGGQRTLQAPHTMQWAVRQRETAATAAAAAAVANTTSSRPSTSAVAAATTGILPFILINVLFHSKSKWVGIERSNYHLITLLWASVLCVLFHRLVLSVSYEYF